jgi:hypothetical protein
MPARQAAPADADAPDPDRAGPHAPPPRWLIHLLVLLRLFALRWRARLGGISLPPDWVHQRPGLPAGSTQALAAAIRGSFGTAIAWMCLRRGFGPGHADWPYLSRTIVAFGGSLAGFRPGLPACGLQWWENPDIFPGMIGLAAPAAADGTVHAGGCCASRGRDCVVAGAPHHDIVGTPARHGIGAMAARHDIGATAARHDTAGLAPSHALPWRASTRAATGPPTGPPTRPPTGPPARHTPLPCHATRPGPAHGQPRRPESCPRSAPRQALPRFAPRATHPATATPRRRAITPHRPGRAAPPPPARHAGPPCRAVSWKVR